MSKKPPNVMEWAFEKLATGDYFFPAKTRILRRGNFGFKHGNSVTKIGRLRCLISSVRRTLRRHSGYEKRPHQTTLGRH